MYLDDLHTTLPTEVVKTILDYMRTHDEYEIAKFVAVVANEAKLNSTDDDMYAHYETSAQGAFDYVDNYDPTPMHAECK